MAWDLRGCTFWIPEIDHIDVPSFSVGRNHANRGAHPGLLLHLAIARVRFIVWSVGWDPGDLRSSTGGDQIYTRTLTLDLVYTDS